MIDFELVEVANRFNSLAKQKLGASRCTSRDHTRAVIVGAARGFSVHTHLDLDPIDK